MQNAPSRRPFTLVWYIQLIIWIAVFCASVRVAVRYEQPGDVRYRSEIEQAGRHPGNAGHGNQEKIFIAAMFYNNEQVIPYWSDSLIKAIRYLGTENVFVSIIESHSDDQSPVLLRKLNHQLSEMHVSRRILIQDDLITKPDDMGGNNRIDFLAALRNRALEPLVEKGGYDKVVFSNDIFIEPETFIELLNTADGEYDMACGMDFGHFGAYDMWVLRDRQGKLASGIWPYFFDEADYRAMQTESPVPVFTCWNGIVVLKADPLLPIHLRSNRTLSTDPLPYELPSTHPAAHDPSLRGPSPALTPPARFRASAPGECFSSESFLLPYDLRRLFNMQRIFVNPRVIVAYDWRFYVYFKWLMRHPVLKWWIEKMYDGAWMQKDMMVVGDRTRIWRWDGGDCHPW
ncbi:glycosyltransferase family 69 protein [Hydnomerulius pinastri MD-312]|uniref:Glycosyltransferase family 69 protein n=1 Tax=Hydnomerulius pinastri MD-312 TaxID=994086 RepID=A0A0C9V422_9AGAM|nr:glycosyltransferase family 69 protein [Hydnomerulius pinastri MD-312]